MALPRDLLRDVRRDPQGAHAGDEAGDVEALVAADRHRARGLRQHHQRRLAFGGARGRGDADIRHQAMAIVEQHVPRVRQLRLAARPFRASIASGSVVD